MDNWSNETMFIVGLVVFLGKEVFQFAKIDKRLSKIEFMTRELYTWHDKDDEDGVKVWYVRKSLEDAIIKLAESIAEQTKIFQALIYEIRSIKKDDK